MWQLLHKNNKSPFRIIIFGFLLVILAGSFLLMLPIATKDRIVTPFLDALFTSTSAVCVTGLIIHDTATYWSGFGQLVIILLIQIGGLGRGLCDPFGPQDRLDAAKHHAGSDRRAQRGRDRALDRLYFENGPGS